MREREEAKKDKKCEVGWTQRVTWRGGGIGEKETRGEDLHIYVRLQQQTRKKGVGDGQLELVQSREPGYEEDAWGQKSMYS